MILVATGAVVAIYAQAGEKQNQIVLIVGIVLLMIGVYRISSTIPSKSDKEDFFSKDNDENKSRG
ncbi:hypothetical protein [Mangrovimonas aestuarii]|uniref:hypothetical protein n=1 Tax=Mangrovimonas aestuarii TaxID=3018443 RepID=UPI00237A0853|nr:hypothetical protein [Mangrovimonas aestuarii]